jgi:hypothetical protein
MLGLVHKDHQQNKKVGHTVSLGLGRLVIHVVAHVDFDLNISI